MTATTTYQRTGWCKQCTKEFPIPKGVRTKLYCSDRCKERAAYQRFIGLQPSRQTVTSNPELLAQQAACMAEERIPIMEPCSALPGSAAKVEVLMQRCLSGEFLWHANDATFETEVFG